MKDVIVGKIYFLLVRIKIKHMEIDIIKRETTGTGPNVYHENDTIAKYEIMDGAPVRGEPSGPGSLLLCFQAMCSVSALGKGSDFGVKPLSFIYLFYLFFETRPYRVAGIELMAVPSTHVGRGEKG